MGFEVKQYLDYNQDLYGEPVYGPLLWQASIVEVGSGQAVIIPEIKGELTTFILIKQMIINLPFTGTGLPITFIDAKYTAINPIFRVIDTGLPWFNTFDFVYVAKDNQLIIRNDNVDTFFSLAYIRVTQQKVKEKR